MRIPQYWVKFEREDMVPLYKDYSTISVAFTINLQPSGGHQVHIFWEGNKILQSNSTFHLFCEDLRNDKYVVKQSIKIYLFEKQSFLFTLINLSPGSSVPVCHPGGLNSPTGLTNNTVKSVERPGRCMLASNFLHQTLSVGKVVF